MKEHVFYKRNLPHYQPDNANYFITFRLAGSLPIKIIKDYIKEKESEELKLKIIKNINDRKIEKYNLDKRFFLKYDKLLDGSTSGNNWLKIFEVAEIVSKSIFYLNTKEYDLIAFCIMPNHVHIVFNLMNNDLSKSHLQQKSFKVTKILQSLKKYTAAESNKILNRTGQFWHRESYDHVIRNAKEFGNFINYLLYNPVKAGFVDEWEKWKWSYCKYFDKNSNCD